MQSFFDEFMKLRNLSLKLDTPDSASKNLLALYMMTMSDLGLSSKETETLSALYQHRINKIEVSEAHLAATFHLRLWCLNGWARYQCFVLKDYLFAEKIIRKLSHECEILFKVKFLNFDAEIKLFPAILALNFTRISYYSGQYQPFQLRREFLLKSLKTLTWEKNQIFDFELNNIFLKNWTEIKKALNSENQNYLINKIDSIGCNPRTSSFSQSIVNN